MKNRLILFVLLAFGLALPASAAAAPAYEPNDGIHQAYGPLAADTNYDATISSGGDFSSNSDHDWYIVYVSGQGVLNISLTNPDDGASCCGSVVVVLRDANGGELNSTSAGPGETASLPYTTPGPGHYYLEVRRGGDSLTGTDDYRLNLTGPITTGPRPGPPDETVPNNNRDESTAFGPLVGDRLYGGSIDARGEEDWFFFNTAGPGAFDIELTNINDAACCGSPTMVLYDHDGSEFREINSTFPSANRIGHIQFTGGAAEQYFLRVNGGNPVDRYQFRITPASMVTATPPPAPPGGDPKPPSGDDQDEATLACQKAQRKVRKAKQKVKKARQKVKKAKKQGKRKKVKKAKSKLTKKKGKLQRKKAIKKELC